MTGSPTGPDVPDDGGVDQDESDAEIAERTNYVYPEATAYRDPDGVLAGFKLNDEPLEGIRVLEEAVQFGFNDSRDIGITVDDVGLKIYDESDSLPTLVPFEAGEWDGGVLEIEVPDIDGDLSMVRGKEELDVQVIDDV